jgi:hypothetical protein
VGIVEDEQVVGRQIRFGEIESLGRHLYTRTHPDGA